MSDLPQKTDDRAGGALGRSIDTSDIDEGVVAPESAALPPQRSTSTTIAALIALVAGAIGFVWGFTWFLIGLSRDGNTVTVGGIVVMLLGGWAAVAGAMLWIRKWWAADAVKVTFAISAVAVLVFGLLSANASGASWFPYLSSLILIGVAVAPIVLLGRPDAKRDFPAMGRSSLARSISLWSIIALWTVPSLGLLLASFREETAVKNEGWWTIFTDPQLTLDNYSTVLGSGGGGDNPDLLQYFMNSLSIVIPATVIPISIALFAAYAFAWMEFPGRKPLFVLLVSLMAVPLQLSLIPLLQLYVGGAHIGSITIFPDLDLNGSPVSVWLTHTGFGLPLAIFLLYNYVSGLPGDLFEAARIDGADHYTIFWRLVVPLSVPALAAFGIFQFLWTWNDYLIALTFIGSNTDAQPITIRLATLSGGRGQDWHVLTAAAFVSMAVPLVVFFSLQRYFVRGLLAGSVKG